MTTGIPASSVNAGSPTRGRKTSGTESTTPGHGPSLEYGLMDDSWSKPRTYAPSGLKTIAYSSPEPLRIDVICCPGAQSSLKE